MARLAATDGGNAYAWRSGSAEPIWTKIHGEGPTMPDDLMGANQLQFRFGGSVLMINTYRGLRAFALTTRREIGTRAPCGIGRVMAWETVVGSDATTVRICSADGRKLTERVVSLPFSALDLGAEPTTVVGYAERRPDNVAVVDLKTGRLRYRIAGFRPVELGPSRDRLLAMSSDERPTLLDASSGAVLASARTAAEATIRARLHHGILVVGSGSRVAVWDVATGKRVCAHPDPCRELVGGPDASSFWREDSARICFGAPEPRDVPPGSAVALCLAGSVLRLLRPTDQRPVGLVKWTASGQVLLSAGGAVETWGDVEDSLVTSVSVSGAPVVGRSSRALWDRAQSPGLLARVLRGEVVAPDEL